MEILVTLKFTSTAEAARILAQLQQEQIVTTSARINPLDNPEVGGTPMPPVAPPAPAPLGNVSGLAFGQDVTLPAGAIPAPSTAVAAATPIAPAAPPVVAAAPGFGFPAPAPSIVPVAPAHMAPAAPSTLAPAAPTGKALDTTGLPWDGRIHAGTQGTNKDGSWKAKKNLDPALKAQVEAELRAALAANAGAVAPAAPSAPFPAIPPAPNAGSALPASPTDIAAALGPVTASGKPLATEFGVLMEQVADAMTSGRLDTSVISGVLRNHGLAAIGQLSYAPNVVPAVAQELAQYL